MWWFRWHARRFFRSVMAPVDPQKAIKWERRLRLLYIFIGANGCVVGYKYYMRHRDENIDHVKDTTSAHQMIRYTSTGGDVNVVRMGFGMPTEKFTVNTEEYRRDFEVRKKKAKEEMTRRRQQTESGDKENLTDG